MNTVFVLGARDQEMRRIEALLQRTHNLYFIATYKGARVKSHTAYDANGMMNPAGRPVTMRARQRICEGARVVFVECSVADITADLTCDHHRPGDPGYDCPPEQYLMGSSLGQVLQLLGQEPSKEDRMAAAADHCPAAAYRGECPGVSPEDLTYFRMMEKSLGSGLPLDEVEQEVREAANVILQAPRIEIAGDQVADLTWQRTIGPLPGLSEASARLGIPVLYKLNTKYGINNARPDAVRWWMDNCELAGVYGNPLRGYAGGYDPAKT